MNPQSPVSTLSLAKTFASFQPFIIPAFQRGYVWKLKDCELLVHDLFTVSAQNLRRLAQVSDSSISERLQNNFAEVCAEIAAGFSHELGCIVLYPETTPVSEQYLLTTNQASNVVDGQQRITTLMLLARAIYDALPNETISEAINDKTSALTEGKFDFAVIRKVKEELRKLIYANDDPNMNEDSVGKPKVTTQRASAAFSSDHADNSSSDHADNSSGHAGCSASAVDLSQDSQSAEQLDSSDSFASSRALRLNLRTLAATQRSTKSIQHILEHGKFCTNLFTNDNKERYAENFYIFSELLKDSLEMKAHTRQGYPHLDRNVYQDQSFHRNLLWAQLDACAEEFVKHEIDSFEQLRALFPSSANLESPIPLVPSKTSTVAQANSKSTADASARSSSQHNHQIPFLAFVALNLLYALDIVVFNTPDADSAMIMFDRLNSHGEPISPLALVKSRIYRGIQNHQLRADFASTWNQLEQKADRIAKQISLVRRLEGENLFSSALLTALGNHPVASIGGKNLSFYCDKDFNDELVTLLLADMQACFTLLESLIQPNQTNKTVGHKTAKQPIRQSSFIDAFTQPEKIRAKNLLLGFFSKARYESYLPVFTYFLQVEKMLKQASSTGNYSKIDYTNLGKVVVEFLEVLHVRLFCGLVNTGNYLNYTAVIHSSLRSLEQINQLPQVAQALKEGIETSNKQLPDFSKVNANLTPLVLDLELLLSRESNVALFELAFPAPKQNTTTNSNLRSLPKPPSKLWFRYAFITKNVNKSTTDRRLHNLVLVPAADSDKLTDSKLQQYQKSNFSLARLLANFIAKNKPLQDWHKQLKERITELVKTTLSAPCLALEIVQAQEQVEIKEETRPKHQAQHQDLDQFFSLFKVPDVCNSASVNSENSLTDQSTTQAAGLFIPDFQRGYVWEWKKHVLPLVSDLMNCTLKSLSTCSTQSLRSVEKANFAQIKQIFSANKHEIGFIGYVRTYEEIPHQRQAKPLFSLIDGQQRLTTLVLLARALYDAINQNFPSEHEFANTVKAKLEKFFAVGEVLDGKVQGSCVVTLSDTNLPETALALEQIQRVGKTNLKSPYSKIFTKLTNLFHQSTEPASALGEQITHYAATSNQVHSLKEILWTPAEQVAKKLQNEPEASSLNLVTFATELAQELDSTTSVKPAKDSPVILYLALSLLHAFKLVSLECRDLKSAVRMFERLNYAGMKLETTDIIKSRLYFCLPELATVLTRESFVKRWQRLTEKLEHSVPEKAQAEIDIEDSELTQEAESSSEKVIQTTKTTKQGDKTANKRIIQLSSVLEPLSYYYSLSHYDCDGEIATGYEPLGLKHFFSQKIFTESEVKSFLEHTEFNVALVSFAFKPQQQVKNQLLAALVGTWPKETSQLTQLQNLLVTLFSFNHAYVRIPVFVYFWKLAQKVYAERNQTTGSGGDEQGNSLATEEKPAGHLTDAITFLRKHLSNLLLNFCRWSSLSVSKYLPLYTVVNILAAESPKNDLFSQVAFASLAYMNAKNHPGLVVHPHGSDLTAISNAAPTSELEVDASLCLAQIVSTEEFAELRGHKAFLALAFEVVERFNSSDEGSTEGFSYNNFDSVETSKGRHEFAGFIDCYETDIEHIGGRFGDALASEQDKLTWLEHAEKIANKVILESSTNRSCGNAILQDKLEGYRKSQFVGPRKIAELYSTTCDTQSHNEGYSNGKSRSSGSKVRSNSKNNSANQQAGRFAGGAPGAHSDRFLLPELEKRSQYLFEQLDTFVQSSNRLYYADKPLMPNYPTERSKLQEWFKNVSKKIT